MITKIIYTILIIITALCISMILLLFLKSRNKFPFKETKESPKIDKDQIKKNVNISLLITFILAISLAITTTFATIKYSLLKKNYSYNEILYEEQVQNNKLKDEIIEDYSLFKDNFTVKVKINKIIIEENSLITDFEYKIMGNIYKIDRYENKGNKIEIDIDTDNNILKIGNDKEYIVLDKKECINEERKNIYEEGKKEYKINDFEIILSEDNKSAVIIKDDMEKLISVYHIGLTKLNIANRMLNIIKSTFYVSILMLATSISFLFFMLKMSKTNKENTNERKK